jgi:hypothetical protein
MDQILNNLTVPQLINLVRRCNIREKIPRYTKIDKQTLISELSKHIELVETDADYQFKAKDN